MTFVPQDNIKKIPTPLQPKNRCALGREFRKCEIHAESPNNCGDCEHFKGLFGELIKKEDTWQNNE